MEDIQIKATNFRHWRYSHDAENEPIPVNLLPTYNDLDDLAASRTAAINYFSELIGTMAAQIEALQRRVHDLETAKAREARERYL